MIETGQLLADQFGELIWTTRGVDVLDRVRPCMPAHLFDG